MVDDAELDPRQLAAERQLERLDDDFVAGDDEPDPTGAVRADEFGVHIDAPDTDEPIEVDVGASSGGDTDVVDVLDAIAEAFNARDLDKVVDLLADDAEVPGVLGNDRANLPEAMESLWHRRPTTLLLRGELDDVAIGVLWEHDGAEWWPIATVHLGDVVEGGAGVLEISEDPELIERIACEPPEVDELDEGARWSEWDEGDGG